MESGGLFLQMTHPFRSQGEATNLLQSLGPPFTQMEVGRGLNGDVTTNQLRGRLVLVDGFDAFADADLVAAVGSQPFAAQIAAAGATPEENMSVTVRASLPGVLESDKTNVEPNEGGILEWAVPLDGSALQWQAETTQQPGEGQRWARPLSIAALVALVGWVAFMGLFIIYVALRPLSPSPRLQTPPPRPPLKLGLRFRFTSSSAGQPARESRPFRQGLHDIP